MEQAGLPQCNAPMQPQDVSFLHSRPGASVSLFEDVAHCCLSSARQARQIQVGHLVPASELRTAAESPDGCKRLILPNCMTLPVLERQQHEWICGQEASLGSILNDGGLLAIPSACNLSPPKPCFKSGCIATSQRIDGQVLMIQLEFPKSQRDDWETTADLVAEAVVKLLKAWHLMDQDETAS